MSGIDVVALFDARARHRYGERVTQLDHALQCAELARREGADDEVVVAALLHDIGHLVPSRARETATSHHGGDGAALVRPFVPERIAWLIEHHVLAKRYLCARDTDYARGLSPASARSLRTQGGALPRAECARLETYPWFADAVRIRRWDDLAKVPDAVSAPLDAYRLLLERHFGPQSPAPDSA